MIDTPAMATVAAAIGSRIALNADFFSVIEASP
jgi:hypothetical protein